MMLAASLSKKNHLTKDIREAVPGDDSDCRENLVCFGGSFGPDNFRMTAAAPKTLLAMSVCAGNSSLTVGIVPLAFPASLIVF
jgi:hypothetical protein